MLSTSIIMMYTLLAALPILFFITRRVTNLTRNYISARKYGLPIILLPVSFEDPWWLLLRPLFSFFSHLPFNLGHWYLYTTMGWPQEDANHSLLKYGENFVLCSPRSNILVTAEQGVLEAVWGVHGKGWGLQEDQGQLFAFYGQNVSSTNGEMWRRHRKITGLAFNEATMRSVWDETSRRAGKLSLGDADGKEGKGETLGNVRKTFDLLAMQILTVVGFGQNTDLTDVPPGHRESLMESLAFILQHVMLTVIFNSLKAPDFLLPNALRRLKVSLKELRLYMQESVLQHLKSVKARPEGFKGVSLLEAMVRANEASKQEQKTGGPRPYLSDSELYGNIFIFNVAGYETTASSFIFSLSYLAAHPDIQDWIREELAMYYNNSRGSDPDAVPDYSETCHKLVRCLAVMNETLRLASPAPMFVRQPSVPTELVLTTSNGGRRSITVTTDTQVGFNDYGAHLSPQWGPDNLSFNPKRFIQTSSSGEEKIVVPEGPVFAPFMLGPRVCPGKKFSQVEFVAVLARVMTDWRVEVVRNPGESEELARRRLLSVVDDKIFHISAHLRRPEAAALRFVRRAL